MSKKAEENPDVSNDNAVVKVKPVDPSNVSEELEWVEPYGCSSYKLMFRTPDWESSFEWHDVEGEMFLPFGDLSVPKVACSFTVMFDT